MCYFKFSIAQEVCITGAGKPHVIDYNSNPIISRYDVSFHWWGSEGTTMHSHNFYEFFLITEGRACHELNGKVSEIGKGTLCMIRPDDCHQLRRLEGRQCIHMNICVSPGRLEKICSALTIDLSALISDREPLITTLSNEEMSFFSSRAQLISKLIGEGYEKAVCVICETASDFVSIINNSKLAQKDDCPEWFSALLEQIRSPEFITCSAADVYKMANFSPPVMIKCFKKYTGKTVSSYLRDLKCEYACLLLSGTQLTTLEISMQLGYYSLSHFTRVFKEYSGLSPAAYRRKLEEK